LKSEDKDFFSAVRPRPLTEENWYEWNVNNWGTKWSPSVYDFNREDDNTIWVSFDSAWSPPVSLYEFMNEEGYDVRAYYHESGMGFVGKFEDGFDDYYEYDISELESLEQLPEDLVEYADLMTWHENWVEENQEEE
jgi:hypothetical protein